MSLLSSSSLKSEKICCYLPSLETSLLALDLFISVVLTATCCKLNSLPSQDENLLLVTLQILNFVQGLEFHEHLLYLSPVLSWAIVLLLDLLNLQNTNGMQLRL